MRYYLRGRICLVFFSFSLFSPGKLKAQAFDFNTFFTANAIGFMNPDSNNMIYDGLHNVDEMVAQLDSLFPFYEQEYYGAYPNIQVSDSISFLPGLHNDLPAFDNKASEIKSAFSLYGRTDYWYAYYKKSVVDTTTAIVIFPGTGFHEGFLISNDNTTDYHNYGCMIKNKCLEYGDVYTVVKPNEDFRSIWKDVGGNVYRKLDYDVLGPYTDLMGKNWAANLYIEVLAQFKYLQSKYKKVIAIGLSNGGFPVLVCGLEAGIDGINCASGLSVSSYTGFPVNNNENPLFSGLLDTYALDSVSYMIHHSATNILFSYGSGDCCTNAYEYNTHSLQNYLNDPVPACNANFFYNFSGHTFPCAALDDFFTNTIQSPKAAFNTGTAACAYDSLQVRVSLTGMPPFSMDLYKDGYYYQHYNTAGTFLDITLYDAGEYYLSNLEDAGNYPLCRSANFTYTKPLTGSGYTFLRAENSYLVAQETPYLYHWYKDDVFIDSTSDNVLASRGSGQYYVLLKDSAGCIYKSNIVSEEFPFNINVYPNPTSGDVRILVDEKFSGSWNYTIYNSMGQRVTSGMSSLPFTQININTFATGLYHFCIEFNDEAGNKVRKTLPVLKK